MPSRPADTHQPTLQRIEDREVALKLLDHREWPYLEPFIGRECTISEASKRSGVSLNSMYLKVSKFEKLGLLSVTRNLKRKGRSIKHYSSIAEEFFIPYATLSFSESEMQPISEEIYQTFESNFELSFRQSFSYQHWGTLLYREKEKKLSLQGCSLVEPERTIYDEDVPALLAGWFDLQLDHKDAKEFQHELSQLIKQYSQKKGAQRYLYGSFLTPWLS